MTGWQIYGLLMVGPLTWSVLDFISGDYLSSAIGMILFSTMFLGGLVIFSLSKHDLS